MNLLLTLGINLGSYLIFLQIGVNVIISGGMGGGAVDIFNERDVQVVIGTKGKAKVAAEAYLHGSLESTGSICHKH